MILIALGIWISGLILDGAEKNYRTYQTAIQIANDTEFNYSIDTKQGNILAPITVHKVDEVKFDEMNKSFPAVKKVEEEYTRHEREVCTTDSEGNESCHTEVYYEWDYSQEWSKYATEVMVAGRKYSPSLFHLSNNSVKASEIIDGEQGTYTYVRSSGGFWGRSIFSSDSEGDLRYSYRVTQLPQSGTIFANTTDHLKPVSGHAFVLEQQTPQERVDSAKSAVEFHRWGFGITWTVITIVCVIATVYGIKEKFYN